MDGEALSSTEYVDDRDLGGYIDGDKQFHRGRTPFSRSYWQKLRLRGEGPPWHKVGRRVVYKWSDVVAWLDGQASS